MNSQSNCDQLIKRYQALRVVEDETAYIGTELSIPNPNKPVVTGKIVSKFTLRLPCRLSSPLIPLPIQAAELMNTKDAYSSRDLNQMCMDNLVSLRDFIKDEKSFGDYLLSPYSVKSYDYSNIMDLIHESINSNMSQEATLIQNIAQKLTEESINLDISQTILSEELVKIEHEPLPDYPMLLVMMTKIRSLLTQDADSDKFIDVPYQTEDETLELKKFTNGAVLITHRMTDPNWFILMADRYCVVNHARWERMAVMPSSYLDYSLTKYEVFFNLDVITSSNYYSHFIPLSLVLKDLAAEYEYHDYVVSFMKQYEGFLNMTADFKASPNCSIAPYIEVIKGMLQDSMNIDYTPMYVEDVLLLLFPDKDKQYWLAPDTMTKSYMYRLCISIRDLLPIQLLEASAFHKFVFYSEIDEKKGIDKFIKRTHSVRDVDEEAISSMIAMFNKTYIFTYARRYNKLPKIFYDEIDERGKVVVSDPLSPKVILMRNKYLDLESALKVNRLERFNHKPMRWWLDLRPWDSEDKIHIGSPLEFAKDKRSCKESITYSLTDSEKELESIIRREEVSFPLIPDTLIESYQEKEYILKYPNEEIITKSYPTMLKEKEREQKKEGRLFGMNTTCTKQTISRYMDMAKHILSYFTGNLMTPQDSKRKEKLHSMAQSLLTENNYCILADIEGHNQSMQPKNTRALLSSIGLCYGETDWEKLAYLYPNLEVFYPMQHMNETYVSRGQLGGIEGWYNPVWTLHTLLICNLLPSKTTTNLVHTAVYSDDIAMIIRMDKANEENIDQTLRSIQYHFALFGMSLKILQTMVSRQRVTMLRQHYIGGIRADSACKRMLSASAFSNPLMHVDGIESASIISACSGALELSNAILPQMRLKYYKYYLLTLRPTVSALATKIDERLLQQGLLTSSTNEMYFRNIKYSNHYDESWIYTDLLKYVKNRAFRGSLQELEDRLNNRRMHSLSREQMKSFQSNIIERLVEDDSYRLLLIIGSLLPIACGGSGLMTLCQTALTGSSDTFSRSLSILKSMDKYLGDKSPILHILLENSLGGSGKIKNLSVHSKDNDIEEDLSLNNGERKTFSVRFDETNLLNSEWPAANKPPAINLILRSMLIRHLRRICVNKELLNLMEEEKYVYDRNKLLIEEFRKNFSYRVASFYASHGSSYILDKLLRKIEGTSSLLRQCRDIKKIMQSMSTIFLQSCRAYLTSSLFSFGKIDSLTNIQEYLFRRRKIMFPKINFCEVIEPDPDAYLVKRDTENPFISTVRTSGTQVVNGIIQSLPPIFGSEALYKGELRDSDHNFSDIREFLLVKIVSVSKWILYRSSPTLYHHRLTADNNIKNAANICLSSLRCGLFEEYVEFVPLLTRSEVLHRIPLIDIETKSAIRTLPAETPRYRSSVNSRVVNRLNLKDSNIHFDFFRLRTILSASVSTHLRLEYRAIDHYDINLDYLVHDVQIDFYLERPKVKLIERQPSVQEPYKRFSESRIKWLSYNLQDISTGDSDGISPAVTADELSRISTGNFIDDCLISYVDDLISESLWDYHTAWSLDYLEPFFNRHKIDLGSLNIKSLEELREYYYQAYKRKIALSGIRVPDDNNLQVMSDSKSEFMEQFSSTHESINNIQDLLRNLVNINRPDRLIEEEVFKMLNEIIKSKTMEVKSGLMRVYGLTFIMRCCTTVNRMGSMRVDRTNLAIDIAYFIRTLKFEADDDKILVSMLRFCKEKLDEMELANIILEVINEYDDFLSTYQNKTTIQEMVSVKYPVVDKSQLLLERGFPTVDYPVTISPISQRILEPDASINMLIKEYINACMVYSSPEIYSSPTGSDVYPTAYSVLKELGKNNIISNITPIFDLTAGRGDWYFAASNLGLNIIAYAREDNYNKIRYTDSINYIEYLDIKNIHSYNDVMVNYEKHKQLWDGKDENYPVIIVDLSFSNASSVEVESLLLSIDRIRLRCLLRIRPDSEGYSHISKRIIDKEMYGMILSIMDNEVSSPYLYMYISPVKDEFTSLSVDVHNDSILYSIMRKILSLRQLTNPMSSAPGYKYNSVVDKILGSGLEYSNVSNAVITCAGYSVILTHNRLIPLSWVYNKFPWIINKNSVIPGIKSRNLSDWIKDNKDKLKAQDYNQISAWLKSHGDRLINEICLESISIDEIKAQIRSNPVSICKQVLRLSLQLSMLSESKTIIPIGDGHYNSSGGNSMEFGWKAKLSKSLINACIFMAYDYYSNNRNASFLIFKRVVRSNKRLSKEFTDSFKCRRLLDVIYNDFATDMNVYYSSQTLRGTVLSWMHQNVLSRAETMNNLDSNIEKDKKYYEEKLNSSQLELTDQINLVCDFDALLQFANEDASSKSETVGANFGKELTQIMDQTTLEEMSLESSELSHLPTSVIQLEKAIQQRIENVIERLPGQTDEEHNDRIAQMSMLAAMEEDLYEDDEDF